VELWKLDVVLDKNGEVLRVFQQRPVWTARNNTYNNVLVFAHTTRHDTTLNPPCHSINSERTTRRTPTNITGGILTEKSPYIQPLLARTASTSRRHLRSAARGDLQVLACRTTSFGPRSFAACAPKLWNTLPPSLRDPTLTLTLFCSRLKTHLFGLAYGRALVTA